MFNNLSILYGMAAARNPGPFFLFAVVFFGLLGIQLAMRPSPVPSPPQKTAEESRAESIRYDKAQKQVQAYCVEKKLRFATTVNTVLDGKTYIFACLQ